MYCRSYLDEEKLFSRKLLIKLNAIKSLSLCVDAEFILRLAFFGTKLKVWSQVGFRHACILLKIFVSDKVFSWNFLASSIHSLAIKGFLVIRYLNNLVITKKYEDTWIETIANEIIKLMKNVNILMHFKMFIHKHNDFWIWFSMPLFIYTILTFKM